MTTAMEWLVERPYSLALTDLWPDRLSGLDLIREIRNRDLPVTIIVMTRMPRWKPRSRR